MLPTSNPTRQKIAFTVEATLLGERAPRAPHESTTPGVMDARS